MGNGIVRRDGAASTRVGFLGRSPVRKIRRRPSRRAGSLPSAVEATKVVGRVAGEARGLGQGHPFVILRLQRRVQLSGAVFQPLSL